MLKTTDQVWATAYHEAGHVAVAYYFGKFVRERGVTIDGPGNGHAHLQREIRVPIDAYPEHQRDEVCRRVRAECIESFAGTAAEERVTRKKIPNGGGDDWRDALALLKRVFGFREELASVAMHLNIVPATRRLLRLEEIWKTIEALSNALYTSRHLSMDEANQILEHSPIRPLPFSYWTERREDYRLYWAISPARITA